VKKEYLSLLCCPYCRGEFEVDVHKEKEDEIIEGKLTCKKCKKEYEIKEGIPILL